MMPHVFRHGYGPRRPGGGSIAGGFILILIGSMFLAGTLLPQLSLNYMIENGWPVLLIALGLLQFGKSIITAPFRGRIGLTGPMVLMTVGVLLALQQWFEIGFDRTWPVLLAVMGISILLRKLLLPLTLFGRLR